MKWLNSSPGSFKITFPPSRRDDSMLSKHGEPEVVSTALTVLGPVVCVVTLRYFESYPLEMYLPSELSGCSICRRSLIIPTDQQNCQINRSHIWMFAILDENLETLDNTGHAWQFRFKAFWFQLNVTYFDLSILTQPFYILETSIFLLLWRQLVAAWALRFYGQVWIVLGLEILLKYVKYSIVSFIQDEFWHDSWILKTRRIHFGWNQNKVLVLTCLESYGPSDGDLSNYNGHSRYQKWINDSEWRISRFNGFRWLFKIKHEEKVRREFANFHLRKSYLQKH